MSDDYNKKVASSELAKLGIVEKKEDTPKQTTINNNQCEVCKGKGYVNLSDTDNVNSRMDCDECLGSGEKLSLSSPNGILGFQDEKDFMGRQMSMLDNEFDDELKHTDLKEKYASLEPDNSDQ